MKIFIKLPNWLGDATMFTPAFEILKEHYKDATFILLAPRSILSLFENEERAILLEDTTRQKGFFSRVRSTFKLGREIAKLRPEISISATSHFFSNLFLKVINSKVRIGNHGAFLTHKVHTRDIHQCMKYARLITPLFEVKSIPDLKLHAKNLGILSQVKSPLKVAIATGAAYGGAKAWRVEHFITLIEMLCAKDVSVILLGSSNEEELNSKILSSISNKNKVLNLTSKLSIQELLSVILESSIFIGNDSGPSHMAVALGVKSILIWGSTAPYMAYPWRSQGFITKKKNWKINAKDAPTHELCKVGDMKLKVASHAIVLNKFLSCSPCEKRTCPLGHHNCMREITPKKVYESILSAH